MASRDWATSKVECVNCGGSHDGTPSGLRKHEATRKHQASLVTVEEVEDAGVPAPLAVEHPGTPAAPALPWEPVPGKPHTVYSLEPGADYDEIMVQKRAYIESINDAQATLRRREADLKWRKNHRPEQAEEYEDRKVRPLVEQITVWTQMKEELDGQTMALYEAAVAPEKEFWAALDTFVKETFARPGIEFYGSFNEYDSFTVGLPGDRYQNGPAISAPRLSFGDREEGGRRTREIQPATIRWSSSSSRSTVADAQEAAMLIVIAAEITQAVNKLFGF